MKSDNDLIKCIIISVKVGLFIDKLNFLFLDHIFDQDVTNQTIFDKMAKPIVHSAIEGFNGTIFAYGQTSSGKCFVF